MWENGDEASRDVASAVVSLVVSLVASDAQAGGVVGPTAP